MTEANIEIGQALASSRTLPSDTALLDTELILCHVLECERSYLRTWPEKTLTSEQEQRFTELMSRRVSGEPVAYIIGKQAFWTLDLLVSPATLIPRPDTELLVELALALPMPEQARILDLGTGTGAIALAIASERPRWHIEGVDCAQDVVELAQQNASRNHLSNVSIFESNWFASVDDKTFDLIVSNPPYIDPVDDHLNEGDVRFEPKRALISDNHGLADIELIAQQALSYLNQGGWLALEHGFDQAEAVRECLHKLGYCDVESRRDLGQHERVTFARKS